MTDPRPARTVDRTAGRGLTVADVARRYRVGPDKVRAWIARAELRAINTSSALCGKPRWVVTPDALAEFDRRRAGGLPPKPARRKRKATGDVDYYPDCHADAGRVEPARRGATR